jgi:hypothetical protein
MKEFAEKYENIMVLRESGRNFGFSQDFFVLRV